MGETPNDANNFYDEYDEYNMVTADEMMQNDGDFIAGEPDVTVWPPTLLHPSVAALGFPAGWHAPLTLPNNSNPHEYLPFNAPSAIPNANLIQLNLNNAMFPSVQNLPFPPTTSPMQSAHDPSATFQAMMASSKASQTVMTNFPDLMHGMGNWDPTHSSQWDNQKPSDLCLGRISRDLQSLFTDPIQGVVVKANEDDITKLDALLTGPAGTPYEGGFFHFYLRCPPDYPITSPKMILLTTGGGTVRFNPNLYANGKVCLSLLGTWPGPPWSPALNIATLLLSVQSLLGEYPYLNEPGLEKHNVDSPPVIQYNLFITHETIRIAVIDMVKKALSSDTSARFAHPLPATLAKVILCGFIEFFPRYIAIVGQHMSLDGQPIKCRFGSPHDGRFRWKELDAQLHALKEPVEKELNRLQQATEDSFDSDVILED